MHMHICMPANNRRKGIHTRNTSYSIDMVLDVGNDQVNRLDREIPKFH